LAVGTENSLRSSILVMVAENPDAIGEQGRGNGFTRPGSELLAAEIKSK